MSPIENELDTRDWRVPCERAFNARGRDRIRNNELDWKDWTSCWFHTDYFITECLFLIRLTSFESHCHQQSIFSVFCTDLKKTELVSPAIRSTTVELTFKSMSRFQWYKADGLSLFEDICVSCPGVMGRLPAWAFCVCGTSVIQGKCVYVGSIGRAAGYAPLWRWIDLLCVCVCVNALIAISCAAQC